MIYRKLIPTAVVILLYIWPNLSFSQSTSIPFSFSLPANARTSAGVFQKDGTLIKTLWNGVNYTSGSHTEIWDGTDEDGRLVPNASYDIRVLSNNVNYTWEGVVGNTSDVLSGPTVHHSFQRIHGMAFTGTTGYIANNYNEATTATYKFDISNPQSKSPILSRGATTNLVATDGNYVYWNGTDANNLSVSFVYATRTNDDSQVTFANGASASVQYGMTYSSALDVNNNSNSTITGLAVQKNGNYLFVAHQNSNQLHVFNKTSGAMVQNLSFNAPQALAADGNGNLWMVTGTTVSKYTINSDGSLSGPTITLSNLVAPMSLAVSPDNSTILAVDEGTSQQLKAYNTANGNSLWIFGQAGGYANGPTVSDDKFFFNELSSTVNSGFVCYAPDGSFWVGDPGNCRVQHYSAARSFIDRIMFIPGFYSAAADPNAPNRVFEEYLEFNIDYTKPLDPRNGSWTLVNNWGYNIPSDYNDAFFRLRTATTLSNGHTYAFLRHVNNLGLVELTASGLRFTGIDLPGLNYRIYPDGSLKTVTYATPGSSSVWTSLPLTGFDANNNPLWGAPNNFAMTPPNTAMDPATNGQKTVPVTSSNIVVAFDPGGSATGYHLGGVQVGTNKWLWRTAKATRKDYMGPYPTDGSYDIGNKVNDYAGSDVLPLDRSVIWGYHGEFWKNAQVNKWNQVYDDGLLVGQFGQIGRDYMVNFPSTEAAPGMAGNAFSDAIVEVNGNAYLYHNDESYHGGLHRWTISGLNTISEQTISVTVAPQARGLRGFYYDKNDVNNLNLKSTSIDASINNNPIPTAITNTNNYSSRWIGFVQPTSSQSYTFYASTNKGVRLWIDGNLIIDKWTNTTATEFSGTTATLDPATRYSVRLETNGAPVSLSWSSSSQSKQIISSANLFSPDAPDTTKGYNLMEALPFDVPLDNNLYGWGRNPAGESSGWSVKTSFKTTQKLIPQGIFGTFSQNGGANTVTRDLGTQQSLNSWKLSGTINYEYFEGNDPSGGGGVYFEVLDDAGKIINRFYTTQAYNSVDPVVTITANGSTIIQSGAITLRPLMYQPQPITIAAVNGVLSITYANFSPVTSQPFDPTSNWRNPKTIRLYYFGSSNGGNVDLENMVFFSSGNLATPPVNKPPIANAGQDINITLPVTTANLNGGGSSDPDGTIVSYVWKEISGPAQDDIADSNAVTTGISNLTQGVYNFQLQVTDNNGATALDTVTVSVNASVIPPDQPPVANAGTDINITLPVSTATLNGSASSDPDGTISTYAWSEISGPAQFTIASAGTATTAVSNLVAGVYSFRLQVTDNSGAVSADTIMITVNAAIPPANLPPVANAGTDINITLPVSTATLNGSASSDPDGTISTYAWSELSGPAQYTIASAGTATTAVSNLVAGVYSFRLQVTDNSGAVSADTIMITVNAAIPPANLPPVANAGTDINITLPVSTATLNGSASSDPDGTISTYAWSEISGPAQYTIASAGTATTAVSNLVAGVYSFRLQVTDNSGAVSADTIMITVNAAIPPANLPPVANAGTDINITLPVSTATLNGSASSDPDGTISTYAWSELSGPAQYTIASAGTATTAVSNLVAGVYSFRLQVTDNSGAVSADTIMITVNAAIPPANLPPVANAGTDINITLPVSTATLNGSASSDPDGTISTYAWSEISGPAQYTIASAGTATTAVSNLVAGVYSFRLQVTDNSGAVSADTIMVTVNAAIPPANLPPVANAGTDINITLPVSTATLNGSASSDPDGTISTYAWSEISGPAQYTIASAGTATTAVSNLVAGVYSFRLQVTDNSGAVSADTIMVTVNAAIPPANLPPVANAGTDINITLPVSTATLNGSASSDPDGTISTYAWSELSGPAQYTIASAGTATTAVSNLVAGVYSFRLQVTDNSGAVSADTIMVTVNAAIPPANLPPVANAGTDINITLPVSTATLNGSASSDPDGTISTYAWSELSGPAQYTIASAGTATTAVSNLVAGVYSFRLQVTDNSGAVSADTIMITVNAAIPPANLPPVANAGTDINITLPVSTATLNGSASSDPDGTISTYAWSELSGPAQYTIASAGTATTAVSNLVAGVYSFRLQVTDNSGAVSADTIMITVNAAIPPANLPPVANAGTDINITLPVSTATLNGSASSDPDGTISTYAWSELSGPAQYTIASAGTATTAVSNLVAGVYSFRLQVTDNSGAVSADTIMITVNAAIPPANLPPVANAGTDINITLPVSTATLNGSASSDPDGTISTYAWSELSGPAQYTIASAGTATTAVSNLVAGVYSFRLQVTDNSGAVSADTIMVTVNAAIPPANLPPVANAGTDINITLPVSTATLNGTASTDPDGTISTYAWSELSGPAQFTIASAGTATTAVSNLVAGVYSFRLQVTDNSGAVSADTIMITVNAAIPPANLPPVANAGTDINITLPVSTATLNGSASSDPDGTISTYAWSEVSGPAQYTIASAGTATTAVSNLVAGVYSFRLQVTDNSGAVSADTIMITVNAAIPPVSPPDTIPVITPPVVPPVTPPVTPPDTIPVITPPVVPPVTPPVTPPDTIPVITPPVVPPVTPPVTPPDTIPVITPPVVPPVIPPVTPPDTIPVITPPVVPPVTPPVTPPDTIPVITPPVVPPVARPVIPPDATPVIPPIKPRVAVPDTNLPPVAIAGPDTTIVNSGEVVILNGSKSFDSDGTIVSYSWKQISGPTTVVIGESGNAVTEAVKLISGEYDFELTVTDNDGAVSTDEVKINIVIDPNTSNSIKLYPNPVSGNSVTLYARNSFLGKGYIRIYDMNGRLIQEKTFYKETNIFQLPVNLVPMAQGIYLVNIQFSYMVSPFTLTLIKIGH